jgi:hypothetical protein
MGGRVIAAANDGTEKPSRMMYETWETVARAGHPRGLPALTDIPVLVNTMPSLYLERHAKEHSCVTVSTILADHMQTRRVIC